jgi:glucose-6-phosphate 1-dehydrogenase
MRYTFGEKIRSFNHVRFRLGPEVAIAIGMRVKRPGEGMRGEDRELLAAEDLSQQMLPYERLLADALRGDASLFGRQDAIEAQWRIVDPILGGTPLHVYEPGTWGPAEADRLPAAHHRSWRWR